MIIVSNMGISVREEVKNADSKKAIALYRKLGLFTKTFKSLAEANIMAARLNKINEEEKSQTTAVDPNGQVIIGPVSRYNPNGQVTIGPLSWYNPNGQVTVGPVSHYNPNGQVTIGPILIQTTSPTHNPNGNVSIGPLQWNSTPGTSK